ncbi:MAG TPA: hypothetical protein VLE22_26765 [Bryobacteraceae bacterium]|nr:hypothetical protein [Bryobacteraceae bacterium]
MGLALMMVLVMGGSYAVLLIYQAWKRNRYKQAVEVLKWLLAGIGVYLVVLLAFSVPSGNRMMLAGEEQKFCGFDMECSLGGSVIRVQRRKTIGNPPRELVAEGMFYAVTVRVTTAKPSPKFKPRDLTGYVLDVAGNRYDRFTQAEWELVSPDAKDPYEITSGPSGGSFKKTMVFDVPVSAQEPSLVLQEGSWIERTLQLFLVADEGSLLHGRILHRLIVRE